MRISELAEHAGVSVATVKYYIREGMLDPGEPEGPRRASYNAAHVRRLHLIQALTGPAGLSLGQAKAILQLVGHTDMSLVQRLAAATTVMADADADADAEAEATAGYPRAERAARWLGPSYRAEAPAAALLERALQAVEAAGFPLDEGRFSSYGEHMLAIASGEIANMPTDADEAVEYTVLGTVLFEPVLCAIRRLAQQSLVKHPAD